MIPSKSTSFFSGASVLSSPKNSQPSKFVVTSAPSTENWNSGFKSSWTSSSRSCPVFFFPFFPLFLLFLLALTGFFCNSSSEASKSGISSSLSLIVGTKSPNALNFLPTIFLRVLSFVGCFLLSRVLIVKD